MSQLTPKMTKTSKFFDFQSFYAFFVIVSTVFLDWNVLKGQHRNISLSSRLFWRANCCFIWKNLQLTPIITKTQPFSRFQRFYAVFSKTSMDFIDWNIEKGQQWKIVLSSRLFRRVYFSFRFENVLNYQRKWQKHKSFKFSKFSRSFLKVSTVFLDWAVLKGQKETSRCPVVFNEEIVAMLWMKISQIDTENDKKLKSFEFPKISFSFFSKISMGFIDCNIEKVNNEKMLCPVGFLEELITVF